MIRFDTEEEAREYVDRWVDEQPSEDLRATITDFVLLLFMEQEVNEGLEVVEVRLDPGRSVSVEFIDHAVSNLRSCLEIDEMLIHAEHGQKAEPGARYEEDQP